MGVMRKDATMMARKKDAEVGAGGAGRGRGERERCHAGRVGWLVGVGLEELASAVLLSRLKIQQQLMLMRRVV